RHKRTIKPKCLGSGADLILGIFTRKPRPQSAAELYKQDFHPNTQKMGLRFTERLRKVFRLRWLRVK
ncbi:MAG: hypothetical protein ACYTCN_08755, partial [Planctomycetota bacterium]